MPIFFAISFLLIGLFMILSPETIYQWTEGWKHHGDSTPSDLYRISIRFGGVVYMIVAIICVSVTIFA